MWVDNLINFGLLSLALLITRINMNNISHNRGHIVHWHPIDLPLPAKQYLRNHTDLLACPDQNGEPLSFIPHPLLPFGPRNLSNPHYCTINPTYLRRNSQNSLRNVLRLRVTLIRY